MRFVPLLLVIPVALAVTSADDILSDLVSQLTPEAEAILGNVQNLGTTINSVSALNGDISALTQTIDPGNLPAVNQTAAADITQAFVDLAGAIASYAVAVVPVIGSQVLSLTNIGTLHGIGASGAAVFQSTEQNIDALATALEAVVGANGGSTVISGTAAALVTTLGTATDAFELLSTAPI